MPSCVVKCCHNTSLQKKNLGITFHRFPKGNDTWKNDLTEVIRKCRGDNNWIPSKYSVICSDHFDANDFYSTKGGLLRISTYAVPKKFLMEPRSMKKDQPTESIIATSVSKEFLIEPLCLKKEQVAGSTDASVSEESVKKEPLAESTITTSISEEFLMEPRSIKKEPLAESTITSFSVEIVMEPQIVKKEPLDKSTFADVSEEVVVESSNICEVKRTEPSLSNVTQENTAVIEAAAESKGQQHLSMLNTPIMRGLKEKIRKKEIFIKNKDKKIKTLKQKIRRLEGRNKSLKNILKSLKINRYVDTELLNKLNENIVAADFFNVYNRKKLKKPVIYSSAIKKFCLTLNYYSPKAYEYVRQTFNNSLPHYKTLSRWHGDLKGDSGLTEESFQALEENVQDSEHQTLCSPHFDEDAFKPQLNET